MGSSFFNKHPAFRATQISPAYRPTKQKYGRPSPTQDDVFGHGHRGHSGAEGQEGRVESLHRRMGSGTPQKGSGARLQRLFEDRHQKGSGVRCVERGPDAAEIQNRPAAEAQEGDAQKEDRIRQKGQLKEEGVKKEDEFQKEDRLQKEDWLQEKGPKVIEFMEGTTV